MFENGELNRGSRQLKSAGGRRVGWLPPASDLDALQKIAEEAHKALVDDWGQFTGYLKRRGLVDRIVPQMLGWYQGWVTIPIFDDFQLQFGRGGNLCGLVLRATDAQQAATHKRYMIPLGSRPMLYVPDYRLLSSGQGIVVVYGMLDALSLCEMRIPVVTTTSGKDSFLAEWLDTYRKPIVVLPDKGEEETGQRLARTLGWRGKCLKYNYPVGLKDPNDLLVAGEEQNLRRALGHYFEC
jgi:hypothetical protein